MLVIHVGIEYSGHTHIFRWLNMHTSTTCLKLSITFAYSGQSNFVCFAFFHWFARLGSSMWKPTLEQYTWTHTFRFLYELPCLTHIHIGTKFSWLYPHLRCQYYKLLLAVQQERELLCVTFLSFKIFCMPIWLNLSNMLRTHRNMWTGTLWNNYHRFPYMLL